METKQVSARVKKLAQKIGVAPEILQDIFNEIALNENPKPSTPKPEGEKK